MTTPSKPPAAAAASTTKETLPDVSQQKADRLTVSKAKDFMAWYSEIVEVADLADKRYPIKGMNVWRPYGWRIMLAIDAIIRQEMERAKHDEVCFPLLIPERLFQKEADHIKGFGGEVFWVTHAGENELEERWLLRPTSETAMYDMFSLWVRSHADLPLRTFQIVNVFRYETKQTRAFMRVREIHFFEDHSCFASFEEAEAHVREDLDIATSLFRRLGLKSFLSRRPEWDKFAGAYYSIGIDVLMPSGRTLQLGSVHQYKTNFSEPYGIKFVDEKGEWHFANQTTYGMSERIVGAVVGVHGDDRGIVLPPAVSPVQVVLVPILFKGKEDVVNTACKGIMGELQGAGLKVHFDDRDLTPGNKYYGWELKGVPLRLEVGPRDIEKGVVSAARRDLPAGKENRIELPRGTLVHEVKRLLDEVQQNLHARHEQFAKAHTVNVKTVDEAKATFQRTPGIIVAPWCGDAECGHKVEQALECKTLGTPFDESPDTHGEPCVTCGSKSKWWVRFANTY